MNTTKIKFGITYFGEEHPEMEIGRRIKVASKNIGVECHFINYYCQDIVTGKDVEELGLDFFIVFDPGHEVLFESYYYHLNWFPPGQIPLQLLSKYNSLSKACNDQLVFPCNKIESLFFNKGISFSKDYIFPSVPYNYVIKPKLLKKGDYKLFYAGLSSGRHAELFAKLDRLNVMKFYGPKRIDGKNIEHNLKSYSGEIPFDGKSIIEISSACGISLAISADIHKEFGVCTNRLFEGLAAGNIVIVDKIEFVEKHFKDTVFMLDANLTLEEKTNQIIKTIDWANKHPEEAFRMANKAQEIFLEKFELTKVLSKLCNDHFARREGVFQDSIQRAQNKSVTIIIEEITSQNNLQEQIENILKQDYNNIHILAIEDKGTLFWKTALIKLKEKFPLEILTKERRDSSFNDTTTFNLLLWIKDNIKTDTFCFSAPNQYWHFNHIRELIVNIEETQSYLSYSGIYIRKKNQRSYILNNIREIGNMLLSSFVERVTTESNHLYHLLHTTLIKSSCLFKTEALNLLKENEIKLLYAYQHIGLAVACYAEDKKISYSEKLTTFLKSDINFAEIEKEKLLYNEIYKGNNITSYGSLAFVLQNVFSNNFNIKNKIQNVNILSTIITGHPMHLPEKQKKYYKKTNLAYVGMIFSISLTTLLLIILTYVLLKI